MPGVVLVLLPPSANHLEPLVRRCGAVAVIDATGPRVPTVPDGAWVRTRPGRPAPGTGPVLLAEDGAPVPGRDTWLEVSAPRGVPAGFAGVLLKGREAGGSCADSDGLELLAACLEPGRVLLDAGVGPRGAAAAFALGAAGVLVHETLLGCPEIALPAALERRLAASDASCTRVVAGLRVGNAPTSRALRSLLSGADPWALASDAWTSGDLGKHLWLVGQGIAIATGLAERYGSLAALLAAYVGAATEWPDAVRRARVVTASRTASTAAGLTPAGTAAESGTIVGSSILWQQAEWLDRPIVGRPLEAAVATGLAVVAPPEAFEAARAALLAKADALGLTPKPTLPVSALPAPAPAPEPAPPPPVPAPTAAAAPAAHYGGAIAIIGMGCRFPDAPDLRTYWSNLLGGVCSIRDVPTERWDPALFYDTDAAVPDRTYTRIGGFITDFVFEPKRFRIPPRVAAQIDPVQQLTLCAVADAMSDAGLAVDRSGAGKAFDRDRCAVILGNSLGGEVKDQYAVRVAWPAVADHLSRSPALAAMSPGARAAALSELEAAYKAGLPQIDEDSMPGELSNVIAGRVAQTFDLGGANFTVDAACASSMAAIQTAVKGLQDGDFDLAISGGADRSMNVSTYVKFCKIGALSPDHSAPFDASANGFVMGEGAGVLILKRVEDAVRDGDRIYAVIRGVGASSDGRGKGITAPNKAGQLRALARAYEAAGVSPTDVDLFECHGTSTTVGDKVEVDALSEFIGAGKRGGRGPARIGSVKSNFGHLKSAAGAASCIKAALALHHGVLPPSLGYKTPRADLDLSTVPLAVQTTPEPWTAPIRRAGVSAFGFGGTNFHVVLESFVGQPLPGSQKLAAPPDQALPPVAARPTKAAPAPAAPAAPPAAAPRAPHVEIVERPLPEGLWATSARDTTTLARQVEDLIAGRSAPWNPSAPIRVAAAADSVEQRRDQLERVRDAAIGKSSVDRVRSRGIHYEDTPFDGKLAFVFTGQGSQYLDMGLDLARDYPVVAATWAEADEVLLPALGRPITDFVRSDSDLGGTEEERELRLRRTEYSQPATLALDVAILRLFASYGVTPDVVAGHSLGEYAAAVAAGVMTFAQALHAVSARGREMAAIRIDDPGRMYGIAAGAEQVDQVLSEIDGYVIAANKNCPSQTVIAGASDAADAAAERFRALGITVHPIPVSHAFHSAIVAPASGPLRKVLAGLGLQAPRRPITTNVNAAPYPTGPDAAEQIIDLLARQISAPVEWTAQIEHMYADGCRVFVECGPKRALSGFTVSILKRRPHRALYTNHPKRGGTWSFRDALAGVLVAGQPVRSAPSAGIPDLFLRPEPRRATTAAVAAHLALAETATEANPDIAAGVLRIVADRSGYDVAELDLDFELEADLGIDTVKQAEVFSVVRDTYGIAPDPGFSFASYRTLRSLIGWAADRIGATRPADPTPAPAPVATSADAAIADFLTAAAAGSNLDQSAFTAAVLPAIQGLLKVAFEAARGPTPPSRAADPVPPVSAGPAAAPPAKRVPPTSSAAAPVVALAAPAPVRAAEPQAEASLVCSGASLGLPGGDAVFSDDNLARMLGGENRIDPLGARAHIFTELGIVKLVKDKDGQGSFQVVSEDADAIRLAGVRRAFDLRAWGVSEDLVHALDIATQLAIAAGYEALRDAGIPLVRTYRTTSSGKKVPLGWALPEALRDDTGVVFGSAFPGYDQLVNHLNNQGRGADGHFDRRFLFQVLSMGHSQLAQIIGARGPNTAVNAACASTTQALAVAEDWIRLGRCRRVIVVGADDVTSSALLPWIGGGFLAAGAASTADRVEDAALPFDRRRHGLVLGMGAVGLVIEREEDVRARGVMPVARLLATGIANSAFHGTRLDPPHIADQMKHMVDIACARARVGPHDMARSALFMSHETYTPARGGSAAAEIEALRATFGDDARRIVITNTKGFTGHPMGAGIEDTVAVKALQYGIIPPIANFREPDPQLGDLTLSHGERRAVDFAIRLAAGFGSQIALTVWQRVATGDERLIDSGAHLGWLRRVTGYAHPHEVVEDRTLRVLDGPTDLALPPPALTAWGSVSSPPVAASAPAPSAPAVDANTLLTDLIALVAERTGYSPSDIEPDFELEADLGIDTVKQAEIVSELRARYDLPRDDAFRLAEHPTLAALARYVAAKASGGAAPAAPSAPVEAPAPVAAPVAAAAPPPGVLLAELIGLVAERTGYSPSDIEPEFELEADLGIDTVKQAEIVSELRARYDLPRDDAFRLADHPTLTALAGYVASKIGGQPSTPPPPAPAAPAPSPAPAAAPPAAPPPTAADAGALLPSLIAIVAERTGYAPSDIEPEFELEADLGIDTVKQAEIVSELRARYALPRDDGFRLADHPTLAALAAYVAGRITGSAADDSPAAVEAPVVIEAAAPAAAPAPAPVAVSAPVAAAPADDDVLRALIVMVADRTGYAPDDVEPDFELEADLGIDTVKQAEIVSEIRQRYALARDDGFRLADYPTLRALAGYVHGRSEAAVQPASTVEPPPAPVAAPADEEAVRTESPPPARASSPAPAPVTSAPLPEAFRVRRPILADRPRPSRPDLTGLVVGIEGVGPVADALVAALRARGAVVGPASSAECVISVGTDVYDLLALARGRDAARPSSWLTVTQAGGLDMVARAGTATGGVATTDTSRVAAVHREGARAGFTKALSHEWRDTTFVRVLDVPPGAAPAEIAAAACDELPRERGATEVFRRGAQRRIIGWKVVNVAPSGVPAATRVLLTGGARGITARIAAELASRAPVVLELVGRGPAGVTPFDEPAAREQARAELKAAGKRVTPVELDKRLAPMRAAEEIRATIVSLEAKGAVVRYHRCDLADPVAVADLVRELQERGPLDLVIHGAGVEESRPIAEKDDAAFHRVFDGKAVGGLALAQAIHPATFFVTMGSVAGRFGNAGQVDYSAANDAMSRVALARPNALSVAWTAWDDVGMAVRGGMRHLLTDRGVGLLPADAGAGVLVDMVAAGVTGEVVVAGALGELWSPPDNPLLDRVEWDGDAVIARRSLTLVGDPWLADHVIEGHAVLPGVVGLELMALTAMEAMPGLPYAGATDVRFDKPVKVYREEPTEVVVEARAVAQGEVQCAVWSERRLRTGKLQRTKSFSATIRLGIAPEIERLPAAILPPEDHDQAAIYRRFFHGPAFQVLTAVTAAASDAATFDGALPASVLTDRTETCPLALEAAFQAAGLLRMLTTHEMALPAFIDEVQLGEVPAPGAPLSILVIQDRDRAQIDIDGPSGPVLRVRGFGMSTLGPLDPARRFSVPDGGRPSLRGRAAGPGGLSPIAQANDAEDPSAWLGHDELAALSARGTERRVQDRIAGRIAAKRALVSMTGLDPHRIVIDNAPTGEPRVLVDGTPSAWRVSIAHREGHAVAIAAGAGRVGIDLESVESRSLSFLADWFHEDEAMERADAHRQTVGWAAKEAVLKVLGTGLALSPRDVLVRAVGRNGQIAVELRGDVAARHRALGGGQLGVTWEAAGPSEVLVVARLTA